MVSQSRRYLRWPGIFIASVGIVVVIGVLGAALGNGAPADVAAPPQTVSPVVPTATPALAVQCPTPAEAVYFASLADIAGNLAEGLQSISSLSTEAANNPVLTLDEEWQLETAIVLFLLQSATDEISALDPPDSVQSIHGDLLQMASELREFVTLYTAGIDNFDADLILLATQRMAEINRLVNVASAKAKAFCQ